MQRLSHSTPKHLSIFILQPHSQPLSVPPTLAVTPKPLLQHLFVLKGGADTGRRSLWERCSRQRGTSGIWSPACKWQGSSYTAGRRAARNAEGVGAHSPLKLRTTILRLTWPFPCTLHKQFPLLKPQILSPRCFPGHILGIPNTCWTRLLVGDEEWLASNQVHVTKGTCAPYLCGATGRISPIILLCFTERIRLPL